MFQYSNGTIKNRQHANKKPMPVRGQRKILFIPNCCLLNPRTEIITQEICGRRVSKHSPRGAVSTHMISSEIIPGAVTVLKRTNEAYYLDN